MKTGTAWKNNFDIKKAVTSELQEPVNYLKNNMNAHEHIFFALAQSFFTL